MAGETLPRRADRFGGGGAIFSRGGERRVGGAEKIADARKIVFRAERIVRAGAFAFVQRLLRTASSFGGAKPKSAASRAMAALRSRNRSTNS